MRTCKIYLAFITLFFVLGNAIANIPYPIIFVHGLTSDHETWEDTIDEIRDAADLGEAYVYHVCLNADRRNDRARYQNDVGIVGDGWRNFNNRVIQGQISRDTRLFAVNFNEDIFNDWTELEYDHSNTAAIYKQGFALGLMIEEVLDITGKDKVILVGHSMGGLAIREYLQRTEGGERIWWVSPNDEVNGHRVAKVVTTGTPHLGSNTWANIRDDPMLGPVRDDMIPNYRSEAVRDLKYSYTDRENDNREINGLYLFGGNENQLVVWDPDGWDNIWIRGYWNNDVNCNNNEDRVTGLNELVEFDDDGEIVSGVFNEDMPLPDNLWYTWIVSNRLGLGGDGIVDFDRQYLYDANGLLPRGVTNALQIDAGHLAEAGHFRSIVMGLDEPNLYPFAYSIPNDWSWLHGFFTPQARNNFDTDIYTFQAEDRGTGLLELDLESIEAMDLEHWMVSIHTENRNAIAWISDRDADNGRLEFNMAREGKFYARFWGRNRQDDWHDHPYRFRIELDFEDIELEPPDLLSPEDDVEVAGQVIGFTWEASRGADIYRYQLAVDVDFGEDETVVDEEFAGLGINVRGFPDDGSEFWWRVRAGNDDDWSEWSEVRSFENGGEIPRPDPPALSSPEDGDFAPGEDITFEWFAPEGAANYHLQVAWDEDFDNLAYSNAVGNRTEVELQGFPNRYHEIWWCVRAGNNQGWSGPSEVWSFINGEEPGGIPDVPQLTDPEDGDFIPGGDIVFEWEQARWAFSYYLQISVDEEFEVLAFDDDIGNFLGVEFEGFPDDNTEFWWRLMAGNNRGWSDWSDERMFTNGRRPDRPPRVPQLRQPENEEIVRGDEAEFEWSRPNLANRFRMELAFDADFEEIAFEDEFGNFTGVSLRGLPDDGSEFWWRIQAGNFRGWSNWSEEWSFFSGEGPDDQPDPPQLVSPDNEAFVPEEDIDFEWREAEFVNNYHLQISVDEEFENLAFDNEVGNRIDVTLEGFTNDNTEFWWRVKAENIRGWSEWCDSWMFTNGEEPNDPPDPPQLVSPEDEDFVSDEEIDFEWERSQLANNYLLQITVDEDFANLAFDNEIGNNTEVSFVDFPNDNTEFWWRVRAGNIIGWSDWSEEWMFTNGEEPGDPPAPPQLVSPEDEAFVPDEDIDCQWERSDLANNYNLQITVNEDFENQVFDEEIGNFNAASLEGFPNDNTVFFWRVRAENVRGWSEWSENWMFTNGEEPDDPPDPPRLVNPENETIVAGEEIDFVWQRSELANNYQIQISEDAGFNNLNLNEEIGNFSTTSFDGFPNDNTEFWWRVKAENVRGWSEWSDERSFINGDQRELTVAMEEGWNLISINVIPDEQFWQNEDGPDVVRMLEQLRIDDNNHHVILFKNGLGQFYLPAWGFNNIPYWNLLDGFQVKVDEDLETTWSGEHIQADSDIPLSEGWNMIGYLPTYELDASAPDFYVLSQIIDNVILAKDGLGHFLLPAWRFSNMNPWRESLGYQIKIDEDVTLNYPEEQEDENVALTGDDRTIVNPHWSHLAPSDNNMSVLINSIGNIDLDKLDQIAAFSAANIIVGLGQINGRGQCGLAIWSDDKSTKKVEGLRDDESFELRTWDMEDDSEMTVLPKAILSGDGLVYKSNEMVVIDAVIVQTLPDDFYLSQNYPNPFNSITRLKYGLPEEGFVSVKIYDTSGRLIVILVNESQSAGHHVAIWEAGLAPSGLYLVRMEAEGFIRNQKLVLTK